ncbi:hypothetical protein [Massilia sp. NP310]|uniref:hypothetical protein n=1 Tax=Massilia sp. NP310 TaxID=2861282 RepID=UPI001C631D4E|nr:hypothetical protein [Massilia sp. NP310]QYG04042.1 hypothetical protein KY496_11990 [Massilia sp. NP310]
MAYTRANAGSMGCKSHPPGIGKRRREKQKHREALMDEELNSSWIQAGRLTDQKSVIDYRKTARDKLAVWRAVMSNEGLINQTWDEAIAMNEAFDLEHSTPAAPVKPAGRL